MDTAQLRAMTVNQKQLDTYLEPLRAREFVKGFDPSSGLKQEEARVDGLLAQRWKSLRSVQDCIGADGKNNHHEQPGKHRTDASKNAARTLRFVHTVRSFVRAALVVSHLKSMFVVPPSGGSL